MLYFVAIGGATCSGKTTLAKLVRSVIPRSVILHQDDFAPPQELVPYHPVHKVQDWDDPDGAILWDKQRKTIKHIRETGQLPQDHFSHDHMNAQKELPVSHELIEKWKAKFRQLSEEQSDLSFVIADGFLILYDEESVKEFDVRLFVREDYETLVARRKARDGYHTAGEAFERLCSHFGWQRTTDVLITAQSDPEGGHWKDPPGYWENIVWPAYLKAHRPLFVNGDVEHGQPDPTKIANLHILEAKDHDMNVMLDKALTLIYDAVVQKQ